MAKRKRKMDFLGEVSDLGAVGWLALFGGLTVAGLVVGFMGKDK